MMEKKEYLKWSVLACRGESCREFCIATWCWQRILDCKTGEIQPCRRYVIQVFVGLLVSIRTGLTVLQCVIACLQLSLNTLACSQQLWV